MFINFILVYVLSLGYKFNFQCALSKWKCPKSNWIYESQKKKKKIRIEDMDLELISTEMVNDTM